MASMKQSKQKYIEKFRTSIFYREDDKLFFLYFMYMVEIKKNNYLSAFAYYKNFFDRISARLAYTINGDQAKGKPNYKAYYREGDLRRLYAGIADADRVIRKAHEIRNSNPLSHSSADLVDSNNSTLDIINSIERLGHLIEAKIAECQTPNCN